MQVRSLDHIVLCVKDVAATRAFYGRVLGMESREERPGKWSLHFGSNKISLQDAGTSQEIARDTAPGSGNFCLLTGWANFLLNPAFRLLQKLGVAREENWSTARGKGRGTA